MLHIKEIAHVIKILIKKQPSNLYKKQKICFRLEITTIHKLIILIKTQKLK